jgi:hypothetical protein
MRFAGTWALAHADACLGTVSSGRGGLSPCPRKVSAKGRGEREDHRPRAPLGVCSQHLRKLNRHREQDAQIAREAAQRRERDEREDRIAQARAEAREQAVSRGLLRHHEAGLTFGELLLLREWVDAAVAEHESAMEAGLVDDPEAGR